MARPKGQPKLGGRKKGTPNKVSKGVKENFHEAFSKIGGLEALCEWAKLNPGEFYKLYAKLLPKELEVKGEGIQVEIVERIVDAKPKNESQ